VATTVQSVWTRTRPSCYVVYPRCLCADKRTYKRRSGIRNRLATSRAAAGCRARDTYHAARDAKNNATRWRRRRRASAGPPGWWLSSTGGGGGDLWAGGGRRGTRLAHVVSQTSYVLATGCCGRTPSRSAPRDEKCPGNVETVPSPFTAKTRSLKTVDRYMDKLIYIARINSKESLSASVAK